MAVKAIVSAPSMPGRAAGQPGAGAARDDRDVEARRQMRTSSATSAVVGRQGDGAGQAGREVGRLVASVATRGRPRRSSRRRPGRRGRDASRNAVVDAAAGHARECSARAGPKVAGVTIDPRG